MPLTWEFVLNSCLILAGGGSQVTSIVGSGILDSGDCQGWITVFVSWVTVYMRRTQWSNSPPCVSPRWTMFSVGLIWIQELHGLPKGVVIRKKLYLFLVLFNNKTCFCPEKKDLQIWYIWAFCLVFPCGSSESKGANVINLEEVWIWGISAYLIISQATTLQLLATRNI